MSDIVITKFLSVTSTYLCEEVLSAVTSIQMRNRTGIDFEFCLILAINNIH